MNQYHSTPITEQYLQHFNANEFRFRWLDATACDLDLSRRANHLAARIITLWLDSNRTQTSYPELQPHLSVRTPRPKIYSSARFIDETIAGIAMSLASPGVQSSSDSSRSWGDEA